MIFKLFVLKEFKKSSYFFLGLGFLLVLGLSGLLSISFLTENIQNNLRSNARQLLTSDLAITARRDFFPEERKLITDFFKTKEHKTYQVVDIYSMVTNVTTSESRLVEIRCYEDHFPFYGQITSKGSLLNQNDFLISKELVNLWEVQTGDWLKIGDSQFKVSGIIDSDSSIGIRGFSLAPRIYLPLVKIIQSGLLRPGSTGQFSIHFKLNESEEELVKIRQELLKLLPDPAIKVMTSKESSNQAGRVFDYITDFMSLSALVGFLLALVGIFYFYQSYLLTRLKDFSLFYLHGLNKSQILFGIFLQFSSLFFFSLFIFFLIFNPFYFYLRDWLSTIIGFALPPGLNYRNFLINIPMLYALSLSILLPLLKGLLRTPLGLQLKLSKQALGYFHPLDFLPFVALLWIVAWQLSHSLKIGSLFLFSLLIIFFLSLILIKSFQKMAIYVRPSRTLCFINLNIGLSLRNFIQSGHKLNLSFIALVLGISLISLIFQLNFLIKKEFTLTDNKPSLFLFDIQEDQLSDLKKLGREKGLELSGVTPLVRGRIEKLNGFKFSRTEEKWDNSNREEEIEARTKNRGINLTYRQSLSPSEKIIAGTPFPETVPEGQNFSYLSIEERFAKRMGIKLGDKIIFDIGGVEIEGIVRNLREVKWTSFYPNFFVNLQPGFIDDAPKTYLAVLDRSFSHKKIDFQKASVNKFPNISFIDMEQLIQKLSELFEKSRRAVELISWLSLFIGFVILFGLCQDQIFRRTYDMALLKSLGFGYFSVLSQIMIEFGFVFFMATGLGIFLGWFLGAIIGLEVFKINLAFDFSHYVVLFLFLIFLCLATIFLVSWKTIAKNPRELLSDN